MKNVIKKVFYLFKFKVWALFRRNYFTSFYTSHSQFGEDMVIRSILGRIDKGFFLDIGAHHPLFYSNTYHFYQKGWRGINVDANPGSMHLFDILRPGDKNIELALLAQGNEQEEVEFFCFKNQAYNTMDSERAQTLVKNGEQQISQTKVKVYGLRKFLEEFNVPKKFELLTLDIEGLDLEILKAWDFSSYRPKIICFEDHELNKEEIGMNFMVKYLKSFGYSLSAVVGPTIILESE